MKGVTVSGGAGKILFNEKGIVITETLLKLPKQSIALAGITSVRRGSNPVYPQASGKSLFLYVLFFTLLESILFLVMIGNFCFWTMGINPLFVLRGIGVGNLESLINFGLALFITTIQALIFRQILVWWISNRRRQWLHFLVVTTASGEVRALEDLDGTFIQRVVSTLENALH